MSKYIYLLSCAPHYNHFRELGISWLSGRSYTTPLVVGWDRDYNSNTPDHKVPYYTKSVYLPM